MSKSVAVANSPSSLVPPDDSLQGVSPTRTDSGDGGTFEVPPEVIDEVSQITEQIQTQGDLIYDGFRRFFHDCILLRRGNYPRLQDSE